MYKTQLSEFCHSFLREMCETPHVIFHFANDEGYLEKAIDFYYEASGINGQVREVTTANIKTEMFKHDNKLYIIFRFFDAKETPEPYCTIVHIDLKIDDNFMDNLKNAKCRYFLSEIAQNKNGVYYCEWKINDGGKHVNYGHFNSINEEDFVRFVINFIKDGDKSVRVYHDEDMVNSKILNPITGEVYILGLVHLELPEPHTWLGVDYSENENIGSSYCLKVNKGGSSHVAVSLIVVEAINDGEEPDFIYDKHSDDIIEIDAYIYKTIRKTWDKIGHEILWWQPSTKNIDNNFVYSRFSSLEKTADGMTNYIYTTTRLCYEGRKIGITTFYDNENGAEYGDIVEKIMSTLRIVDIAKHVTVDEKMIKN